MTGPRTGLYTGSFDPLTHGHLHVIDAAARFCDRLVVAVGVHPTKTPFLSAEERLATIEAEAGPLAARSGCALEVARFEGLAVDAARRFGATLIVRGLRDGTDFDYEMQMAGMNAAMAPDLRTIFVPAAAGTRALSSTLVRQVAAMGGDVGDFVPRAVLAAVARRRPGG